MLFTKIMKGECNGKTGNIGFPGLDTAEPPLILSKDNVCPSAAHLHKGI